jgi:hypothetical protein
MKNLRIAYSKGRGPISWLIRKATRSDVNHALFLVEEAGAELVVGADWNGLVMQTRARWERTGSRVVDVPPLARSLDDGIGVLLEMLDRPYDYAGLLGMPVVLAARFWFRRRCRNPLQSKGALFCSEAAATLLRAVGYPGAEQLDPATVDPGWLRAWQRGEVR